MKSRATRHDIERVIEQNLDYLVRFAFFRVGSRDDAEDIVHSAVERLLSRDASSLDRDALRMYLFRTIYNMCVDHARRLRPVTTLEGVDIACEDDDLELRMEMERIEGLLRRVPEREQEVIRLRVVDEMTFVEIADLLGIPVTTANSRFKAGMGRLRSLYNK